MSEADVDKRMSLLTGTTDYKGLSSADVIIEAVYENIDVKVETFKKIEAVAKPGAILANNCKARYRCQNGRSDWASGRGHWPSFLQSS